MPTLGSRIALLAFATLLQACTGSKPLSKKATKLDAVGMYAEAAEMYLQSALRNNGNIDAKIGLKKTGQMVLDDKLGGFFRAVAMGGDKSLAVSSYQEAIAYQERVRRVGVQLEVPDHYAKDYDRVKGELLVELYEEGQDLLDRDDHRAAEQVFAKIVKLEPGYRDASSLQAVAYLEPLYRNGKADLEAGRYRKAYTEFDQILRKDPSYRDASALRQQAITKGQFSIAVLPFTSTSRASGMVTKVQAYSMTALTQTKDPFLRIVDRENMDRILEEQRLSLSGVVDEQTAVRVGNLMGAHAVLMGNLIEYREEPGQLRRSTKDGYESYRVQLVNKETGEKYFETRYKAVRYNEFYQENKVYMSFSYRLVSLETGEVLVSKVVDREVADHMYYAAYEGNRDALFPARNGVVDLAGNARRDLVSLLNAPRQMKSVADLSNQLVQTASSTMASSIQAELNSRLP
ncbi:MAG: hypothetical protein KF905_06045 [Flavobacteriales bacterium]|nr:hypothetical protein [Flavobacteriales bacterium]